MACRISTLTSLLASALLVGSLAPNALAQTTPAQPSAGQTTPSAPPTPVPTAKPAPSRQSAAVERRIADLHTRLKITPAEQKPFDDFAQVMRDNAQRMDVLVQKHQGMTSTGSAVDQMRSYTDMAQAHAEDMQHLSAAFATLYDSLSADQKKAADLSFRQFAAGRRGSAG